MEFLFVCLFFCFWFFFWYGTSPVKDSNIFTINVSLEALVAYFNHNSIELRPMGYNNIKYENAHRSWHPRGLLGLLIQSQCVATLIIMVRMISWFSHVSSLCMSSCLACVTLRLHVSVPACRPKSCQCPGDYNPFLLRRHPCFIAGSALQTS
jgi:hypothetical protein